jgi:hypothetical protein
MPRTINGQLEGRWASDRVWGGGLVLPEGICYWPWMATGSIDYAIQNFTFGVDRLNRTYRYLYDRTSFAFQRYGYTGLGEVRGQELDAQGRVYLSIADQWTVGGAPRANAPIVAVFG